jgi:hypothetical protein
MDNTRATYACSQAYALFNYSSTILRLFFDYSSTILQPFFDHSIPATKQGTPLVEILTPPAPVSKPAPAKAAPVVKTTTTTTKKAAATTSFQLFFNHSWTTLRPSFYYSSTIFRLFFGHSYQPFFDNLSSSFRQKDHGVKHQSALEILAGGCWEAPKDNDGFDVRRKAPSGTTTNVGSQSGQPTGSSNGAT